MKSCTENLPADENDGFARFGGYDIWTAGPRGFIDEILLRAKSNVSTLACYLNAHTYNMAYKDDDYRTILHDADILYPDGISITAALRLSSGQSAPRMTGLDFFDDFLERTESEGLKLYLLGSEPGVAEQACESFEEKYPNLHIAGVHHGYLNSEGVQIRSIISDINESGADILLVGMGSPFQEKFASENANEIDVPVIWTVGALFDYYAGRESPSPRWIARAGFEWAYRLMANPRGKWKRYLLGNGFFVFRALKAIIRTHFTKEIGQHDSTA